MVNVKKGSRVLSVPESALHVYLNDGYTVVSDDASASPKPSMPIEIPWESHRSKRRKK